VLGRAPLGAPEHAKFGHTVRLIRGLLSESGIVLPLKAATVRREVHKHLEDLPGGATPWSEPT
jgi:hypothetical protein